MDLRLYRSPGSRGAASTTCVLGPALFGTLLVFPLDYQVDRGESPLSAEDPPAEPLGGPAWGVGWP
jgi:hypothetical protein